MFYPARMNSVVIGIHNRWLMDVTSALHEQGELEVLDLKKGTGTEIPQTSFEIPRGDIERIISLQFRYDRILEILEPYEVRPEGVLSLLFPKDSQPLPVRYDTPGDVFQAAYEMLDQAEPVLTTYEALKQNRELQQVTRERIENLNRLAVPGCSLSYLAPAPYTFLVAGWILQESLPLLEAWFRESGTDEIYLHRVPNGQEIIVLCIGTRAMRPLLEELVHRAWFFRITLPETYAGLPGEMISSEQARLEEYIKEEEGLTDLLVSTAASQLTFLRAIREELSIWRDRFDVSRNYGSSRDVVYLHGWIRKKDTDRLHDVIKKVTDDEFFLS
jgi:vacuolar-type H+-ATPase subunit I/STV1